MKKIWNVVITVVYIFLVLLYLNPKEIFDFFWYVDGYTYIYGIFILLILFSIFLIYKTVSLIILGINSKKIIKIISGVIILTIFTFLFIYIRHIEITGCLGFQDCWASPPSTTETPCVPGMPGC